MEMAKLVSRNQTTDHPMLLFYSPIGDDICNMDVKDPLKHMTNVTDFKSNVLNALQTLEGTLPPGSHVVFVGLVDGTILWDTLHDTLHPFGITYRQLYTWLLCTREGLHCFRRLPANTDYSGLGANPCTPWLNPDPAMRTAGSLRAKQLSDVYMQIIQSYKFKNFDMAFYPFPLKEIMDQWIATGGLAADLIEKVDGFHPSQVTVRSPCSSKERNDLIALFS
jgi:acyloxyacyl hydrolase